MFREWPVLAGAAIPSRVGERLELVDNRQEHCHGRMAGSLDPAPKTGQSKIGPFFSVSDATPSNSKSGWPAVGLRAHMWLQAFA